jgi:hypothetical protein
MAAEPLLEWLPRTFVVSAENGRNPNAVSVGR